MSWQLALLLPDWIGRHSALHSHGVQAARIENLWWLMFWVCSGVFVLVMVALGLAITRASLPGGPPGPIPPQPRRRMTRVVAAAMGVTILTLFALLIASVSTGRAIALLGAPKATVVRLIGHPWWWRVEAPFQPHRPDRQRDPYPRRPAGAGAARVARRHPQLLGPQPHGKRDLIPGHDSEIWIEADRPRVYQGLCAEFVMKSARPRGFPGQTAETPERFGAWDDAQLQPGGPPLHAAPAARPAGGRRGALRRSAGTSRGPRPPAGSAPTCRTSPAAAPSPLRGCPDPPATSPAGSSIRRPSRPEVTCRPTACPRRICRPCWLIRES